MRLAILILALTLACAPREMPTTDNQQPPPASEDVTVRRAVESPQGSTAIESAPATSGDVGRPIVPAAPSGSRAAGVPQEARAEAPSPPARDARRDREQTRRPRTMQSFADIAPSSTQPAPVITVPIEIRGTEIFIPCDFRHGKQRMNVRLTTADLCGDAVPEGACPAWQLPAFRALLGVDSSQSFPVKIRRRRHNVDSDAMTIRVPAGFPATASFGVNDLFQFGDVIVIPWNPGLMARRKPDRTIEGVVVSIVQNASGDPYTRPAGVMP
jgi:hypothetical protein